MKNALGVAAAVVVQRVRRAGQSVVGQLREGLQVRQQAVLVALQQNLRTVQIDLAPLDLQAVFLRFLNQVRYRPDLLRLRNLNVVQRNNVHVVQPDVLHAVAVERVLQHDLLLRHVGLRDQQVLFARRDLRRRARHFNRRQRPDLHLLLVAVEQLLRRLQRLLLDAHGLVEAHQVPVQVEHRADRRHYLQFHLQIAHLQIVLRHPDVAVVDAQAPPLQQVLVDLQVEVPADRGVEQRRGAVEQAARVDERDGPAGPGIELLRVLKHELLVTLRQGRGLIQQRVGQRRGVVPRAGAQVQVGIQAGRHRPDLADDSAAAAQPAAAAQAIPVDADSRRAHAGRARRPPVCPPAAEIRRPPRAAELRAPGTGCSAAPRYPGCSPAPARSRPAPKDKDFPRAPAIPTAASCSASPAPPPVFPDGRASGTAPRTSAAAAIGSKLQTIGQKWSSLRQAGPRRRHFRDDSFFPWS